MATAEANEYNASEQGSYIFFEDAIGLNWLHGY